MLMLIYLLTFVLIGDGLLYGDPHTLLLIPAALAALAADRRLGELEARVRWLETLRRVESFEGKVNEPWGPGR